MSNNPTDTLVAGLAIGVSLTVIAVVIISIVRSEWSERQAKKAERIIADRRRDLMVKASSPVVVNGKSSSGVDDVWAELLATPRVPMQREGWDS